MNVNGNVTLLLQNFILQLLPRLGDPGAASEDRHGYIFRRQVPMFDSVDVLMLYLLYRFLPALHLLEVEVALFVWKVLALDAFADNFLIPVVHAESRHIRVVIGPLVVLSR